MINIQSEVQKIHSKYGVSEKANYEIQLLCEQYANRFHITEVEKLNKPAVSNCTHEKTTFRNIRCDCCDDCGEIVTIDV